MAGQAAGVIHQAGSQSHGTRQIVREFLIYDPASGVFTWRSRERRWFKTLKAWKAWNTLYSGKRAGCVATNPAYGYQFRQISMLGKSCKEHRLAWLWMTGNPAPEEIDHKNRDGTDNRWCNIRASAHAENARNQSMRKSNSSGVTGVTWHKRAGKWRGECEVNGESYYLGLFADLDEAAMEIMEFRIDHGFDPHHGLEVAKYHREAP